MVEQRYALVSGGVVLNVILVLEGQEPPAGAILLDDGAPVSPGDLYDGETFSPAPPRPLPGPVRVSKADFQRLFTPLERYKLNALRKVIAALQPADYEDPANGLILAAEDVMFAFEQPLEFIELDHPETAQGLQLLAYLDILTPDRIEQIVANVLPA